MKALDGVDIAVDEGEIVALMGPNGAGKSTILKSIFGLAPIYSGSSFMAREGNNAFVLRNGANGHSFRAPRQKGVRPSYRKGKLELGAFLLKNKEELKIRLEEALDIFPVLKEKIKVKAGDSFRRPAANAGIGQRAYGQS